MIENPATSPSECPDYPFGWDRNLYLDFCFKQTDNPNYDEKSKNVESEYWHAKSLEIAWTFLPSD